MTDRGHVLLVGDPGPAGNAVAALATRARVSWFSHLPRIAHQAAWPYHIVQGLHRDADPDEWVRLATGLSDQWPVDGVWHVGTELAGTAEALTQALAVPLVGGPTESAETPAPAGASEFSIKLVRSGGEPRPLLITHLQRHPASATVVAESGPHRPLPGHDLRRWCAAQLPSHFLGSVDFRIDEGELVRTGLRPWQPHDGLADLLAPYGLDTIALAASILTGAPPAADGCTDLSGVAIAGYGSEAAGTLVALEGLADAAEQPGVVGVTELARAGDVLRPMDDDGEMLVRVTAVAGTPEAALSRAVASLRITTPVVDMPPQLAGALERRWF